MLHSADCENGLVKMSRYLQERLVQLGKAVTKMTDGILAVVMRRNQPSPIYDFVALRAAVILGCYGRLFFFPLAAAKGDAELVAKAGGVHNPKLAEAILAKAKKAAEQAVNLLSQ